MNILSPLISNVVADDLKTITETFIDWNQFENKTILITGANGFLPAYMVETLLFLNTTKHIGCRVIGLVRNLTKAHKRFIAYQDRSDLLLIEGDISKEIIWPERCDFIIHAASQASPKFYGPDPVGTMTANILGTHNLLHKAREWQIQGFLFFSSGEVYGQVPAEKTPTSETNYGYIDINDSRSCYAESKRAAETLGISYHKQFGIPFKIVRPFHTYGPGMALDDGRVFADFVRDVVNHQDLLLRSDGKAVRSFCYLSDAVAGFFTVLLKGTQGTAYNVGNPGGAITISDLADLLAGLFPELKLKVERTHHPVAGYLASPVSISIPNVNRLVSLGWHPTYMLRDGFIRTIDFFNQV